MIDDSPAGAGAPAGFESWLGSFNERRIPLEVAFSAAYWNAQTAGRPEDEERLRAAEEAFRELFRDPAGWRRLTALQKEGSVREPLAARQLDILRREFEENQMDAATLSELVSLRVRVEGEYASFRAELGGEQVSDNRIRDRLRDSRDDSEVRAAWEASKQIGPRVAPAILKLVEIRNRVARALGYPNHQSFSLQLNELDPGELFALLDRLERATAEPFRRMKADLDRELAARFGLPERDLAPWHYGDPFFQSSPRMGAVDFDAFYEGKDLVDLTTRFFGGVGLDIGGLLERSDLYERPGKCQHAFCIDIDRAGDVRVLCNLKPNEKWMGTMLHEFGHAVYDRHFDPAAPYLLRGPAHTFTTEAIAMLFGRLSQNERFLARYAGAGDGGAARMARAAREELRRNQIVFIRWGLVMVHFERELYRDPAQDLDALWWDLVERFQLLRRPPGRRGPDWAAKIHIASSPIYYQNYILGELTASQLQSALLAALDGGKGAEPDAGLLLDRPEVGEFLIERLFRPGRRWPWAELIERATGAPLDPEHFIAEFAG